MILLNTVSKRWSLCDKSWNTSPSPLFWEKCKKFPVICYTKIDMAWIRFSNLSSPEVAKSPDLCSRSSSPKPAPTKLRKIWIHVVEPAFGTWYQQFRNLEWNRFWLTLHQMRFCWGDQWKSVKSKRDGHSKASYIAGSFWKPSRSTSLRFWGGRTL